MMKSIAIRRPGSAALDLSYVAAGRCDGYWELKMHSWDVAAGCLMVTEAGGKVTNFQNRPFSIYDGDIIASNGWIHEEMLRIIQEIDMRR
jgi:myo-inositol-1(or 4)-monophosphatase